MRVFVVWAGLINCYHVNYLMEDKGGGSASGSASSSTNEGQPGLQEEGSTNDSVEVTTLQMSANVDAEEDEARTGGGGEEGIPITHEESVSDGLDGPVEGSVADPIVGLGEIESVARLGEGTEEEGESMASDGVAVSFSKEGGVASISEEVGVVKADGVEGGNVNSQKGLVEGVANTSEEGEGAANTGSEEEVGVADTDSKEGRDVAHTGSASEERGGAGDGDNTGDGAGGVKTEEGVAVGGDDVSSLAGYLPWEKDLEMISCYQDKKVQVVHVFPC